MTESGYGISASLSRNLLLSGTAMLTLFSLSAGTGATSCSSVLLLTVFLFSGVWYKNPYWWWSKRQWLLPVAALMLLPWVSLIWTINPSPGLYPYLQRSHFWLISFAMASLAFRDIRFEWLALSSITGVELATLLFVLMTCGLYHSDTLADYFLFRGYITYSLLLVLATTWLSFWFKKTPCIKGKIVVIVLILLNLAALAMTKGRSGYLAFFALSPVLAINLFAVKNRWLVACAGVAMAGVILFSPTVQQRIKLVAEEIRLHRTTELGHDGTSIGIRLHFWEGGIKIFKAYPLLGAGIDGYQVAMKRLYPDSSLTSVNPHNYYVYIAACYGLSGIGIYCWFLFVTFRRAWPERDSWQGFMLLTTLLVVGIGSLSEVTPLQTQTGILLAMMAGLPSGVDE